MVTLHVRVVIALSNDANAAMCMCRCCNGLNLVSINQSRIWFLVSFNILSSLNTLAKAWSSVVAMLDGFQPSVWDLHRGGLPSIAIEGL
jgi:hypothetical protein